MSTHYDAIVVGAGQAGPPLVARLAAAGQRVALIERHLFGGTCVNTGCTPTKTLVASARVARQARTADAYGIAIGGPVSVDMRAVMARKQSVLMASRDGVESWMRGTAGCTVIQGHARFLSPTEMQVGDQTLSADRIFLDVGGRALRPDLPGIDSIPVLNNSSLLQLDRLPDHLVIVGGSYIGLEFAQIYRRFGARVTVIERGPRLIAHEDADVSNAIREILEAEGIVVRLDADCIRFAPHADGVQVGVSCAHAGPDVTGSHVLLAIGRRPNTDDLGLDRAGIATDSRGIVTVDDQLRTSAPNVWALGDCNGRGAFTHTAYNDHEIVADNLLAGATRRVSDRIPGYALYTDPPLGRVGLTETEARARGHRVRIGMRPMTRVGRAVEKGETQGFMKIVVDADSQAILGGAILGPGGDEAIHGVLDMMNARAPYPTLQHAVPIHPTVSELIPTILDELGPPAP